MSPIPHTWLLDLPAGRLAASTLAAGVAAEGREAHRRAIEALERGNAALANRLLEPPRGGREPSRGTVDEAGRWLSRHEREVHDALAGECEQGAREMRRLLERVARRFDGADGSPARAFVVGAAHVRGTPWPDAERPDEAGHPDHYLALLSALFERVLLLLRAEASPRQRVWATVARRFIQRAEAPRLPLCNEDLGQARARAAEVPFHRPARPHEDSAWIIPAAAPPRYDARVHPGVVLADFVVNRLRRAVMLAGRHHPWRVVRACCRQSFALPVEAAARELAPGAPLPAVAGAGAAGAAVRAALSGEDWSPRLSTVRAAWVREQAEAWARAAAAWRGGAS